MIDCPICGHLIRPGENRTPDSIGPIHSTCADRIIEHDCGQRLLKSLDQYRWLTTADDAESGFTLYIRNRPEAIISTELMSDGSLHIRTESRELSADTIDNDPRYLVIE